MKLTIWHGRDKPDQQMNDWGSEGSVLEGVIGIRWTYGILNVLFESDVARQKARAKTYWVDGVHENSLQMPTHEDMVIVHEYTGFTGDNLKTKYFGDWILEP